MIRFKPQDRNGFSQRRLRPLWLLDGTAEGLGPVQVTHSGETEIIGWSQDGQWLAYLTKADTGDAAFLGIVDGHNRFRYRWADQPLYNRPAWSPINNSLVFAIEKPGALPAVELKLAKIEPAGVKINTLLSDDPITDWVWHPDGEGIILSTARGADSRHSAAGLQISPSGRYLAYYLRLNSASISADGAAIHLLDLQKPSEPKMIGFGLIQREWLAWSPDEARLAFIFGGGREAAFNKRLHIFDMSAAEVIEAGLDGYVDTLPVWRRDGGDGLLFLRGQENTVPDYGGHAVFVPGGEIWLRLANGDVNAITLAHPYQEHRMVSLSPSGKYIAFVSLAHYDQGALFFADLQNSTQTVILKGLTGPLGYYGNYTPAWLSVHFLDRHADPKILDLPD